MTHPKLPVFIDSVVEITLYAYASISHWGLIHIGTSKS